MFVTVLAGAAGAGGLLLQMLAGLAGVVAAVAITDWAVVDVQVADPDPMHIMVPFPLFLANEGHVDRDIRPAVDRLRRIHRSVEIELLPALVHYASFREFLAKLVVETER